MTPRGGDVVTLMLVWGIVFLVCGSVAWALLGMGP
jgi:hypothetical protein